MSLDRLTTRTTPLEEAEAVLPDAFLVRCRPRKIGFKRTA